MAKSSGSESSPTGKVSRPSKPKRWHTPDETLGPEGSPRDEMQPGGLQTYAEKRNFEVTSEPRPELAHSRGQALTFVVQKHAASHLHYDFRLELNGTLVSWAVPKGPSLNPKDKRLAVHVEDHPLEYGGFEGMIPQGEYGGGEVIVWDRGTYETPKAPNDRASQERELNLELERGTLEFDLHGEKLKGGFVLIHTRGKQWLLMKRSDAFASERDILVEDRSVLTGHRIGGVLDFDHLAVPTPTPSSSAVSPPTPPSTDSANEPPHYLPMLLTEVDQPFSSPEWEFELKMDGVRVISTVYGPLNDRTVRILTRNDNDVTSRFPMLVEQLKRLPVGSAVLDGEVVQFDETGRPNFQALIQPFQAGKVTQGVYCVFDVLYLDGRDLSREPLRERREVLNGLRLPGDNLRKLDAFPEDGKLLFEQATQLGFEGIVGKRLGSPYQAGKRSKDWVKVKGYHSEEFVIAGFTKGENARSRTFGALILAQPRKDGLFYSGNVGGGFRDQDLDPLRERLEAIQEAKSSLVDPPKLKGVTWVRPEMVAEVRFANRTNEGRLRFPIFQRLRPDVSPDQVNGVGTDSDRDQKVSKSEATGRAVVGAVRPPAISPVGANPVTDLAPLAAQALLGSGNELHLDVDGGKIRFTNLDKELWPGVTKRALALYYAGAGETLLRYLKNRPLSFVRCPEGVGGERFFQKHLDKGRPDFMDAVTIFSGSNEGPRDFIMCNNLQSLLWCAQMSVVELNPWNSRMVAGPGGSEKDADFSSSKEALEESVLNRPDYLVLDLDPYFGGKSSEFRKPEWDRLVEVALTLKEILDTIGLKCFPKSSGKSGLHLYLPVERVYTYDQIRAAATILGDQAMKILGKKVTLEWNIRKRPQGVFIDVNQNVRGKTMAAPYSPRAATHPGVSMPLLWDELTRVDPTGFTVLTAPARLSQKGDLWAETLNLNQKLFT